MLTLSSTRFGRALQDRGLVRPPALQIESSRTASRLELFFDLAFVLVVAELAGNLREHLGVPSLLRFAGPVHGRVVVVDELHAVREPLRPR